MKLIHLAILCVLAFCQVQCHETIKVQPRLMGTPVDQTLPGAPLNNVAFFTIDSPNTAVCTGALINKQWIVTAASCVKNRPPQIIRYISGIMPDLLPDQTYYNNFAVPINIVKIHPAYNDTIRADDIALIKTFTEHLTMKPYKITRVNPEIHTVVLLRGYGPNTVDYNHVTQELYENVAVLTDNIQCRQFDVMAQDDKLCTLRGVVCPGDQGGPIVLRSNPKELIGIISVSPGVEDLCGFGIIPVVTYTNIFLYRDWITQVSGVTY